MLLIRRLWRATHLSGNVSVCLLGMGGEECERVDGWMDGSLGRMDEGTREGWMQKRGRIMHVDLQREDGEGRWRTDTQMGVNTTHSHSTRPKPLRRPKAHYAAHSLIASWGGPCRPVSCHGGAPLIPLIH